MFCYLLCVYHKTRHAVLKKCCLEFRMVLEAFLGLADHSWSGLSVLTQMYT